MDGNGPLVLRRVSQKPGDWILNAQLPVGFEPQNRRRGEVLGERTDVEPGIRSDGTALVAICKAVAFAENDLVIDRHQDCARITKG
jgi:hypothetical protein